MLEGTMHFFLDDEWVEAHAGSFVLVPGGITHTFENRSDARTGALSISAPGNFEERMPGIAAWFINRDPSDTGC